MAIRSWRSLPQRSLFVVIQRTWNIAQQFGLTQVEFAFDVTTGFVDQFAAFQLPKDVPALGVDQRRLDLLIEREQRPLVFLAVCQLGAGKTLVLMRPDVVYQIFRQVAV
jgi:hypothetical protein